MVTSQWAEGFNVDVFVLNSGPAVKAWTVTWAFTAGQQVADLWNGQVTQEDSAVTVTNMPYNAAVGAGQVVSFGFTGTWMGSNPVPTAAL